MRSVVPSTDSKHQIIALEMLNKSKMDIKILYFFLQLVQYQKYHPGVKIAFQRCVSNFHKVFLFFRGPTTSDQSLRKAVQALWLNSSSPVPLLIILHQVHHEPEVDRIFFNSNYWILLDQLTNIIFFHS